MVQVVEWGWIYEMDVVAVEADGRDSMELGMEDIEGSIEDVLDFPNKVFSNHLFNTFLELICRPFRSRGYVW